MLTLVGCGGVGKTRLALATAEDMAEEYADGVWLVELAPLNDPRLVPKAVASVLRVPEQPGRPIGDSLVEGLSQSNRLLILDNCEHLVRACSELILALLTSCPELHVLATSRQPLRVPGERVWTVPPLAVPSGAPIPDEQLPAAVELFVTRAAATRSEFRLTAENVHAIGQIVRELDGVPLAIELAAARVPVLSTQQIAGRLDGRLHLLTGGSRAGPPRQQTLRGTLDWSHDLLSSDEQTLFRRLAVFSGGWTIEAAESVCAEEPIARTDVLDLLAQLADKSLVSVEDQASTARYRLLEATREYAWERLRAAGEEWSTRNRHRDWCLELAEEAEPHLYRVEQLDWFARLEREHENLRAALAWSGSQPDGEEFVARIAAALGWFWYLRGHLAEGRDWLERGVRATQHARALLGAGWMAYGHGELARASEFFGTAVEVARGSGDHQTVARALLNRSFTLRDQGDPVGSAPLLDESLELARQLGDTWCAAFACYLQGVLSLVDSHLERATDLCGTGAQLFRQLGDRFGLSYCLHALGRVAIEAGDLGKATVSYEEALELSQALGNRRGMCFSFEGLAAIAYARRDLDRYAELRTRELRLWRELGNAFRVQGVQQVSTPSGATSSIATHQCPSHMPPAG